MLLPRRSSVNPAAVSSSPRAVSRTNSAVRSTSGAACVGPWPPTIPTLVTVTPRRGSSTYGRLTVDGLLVELAEVEDGAQLRPRLHDPAPLRLPRGRRQAAVSAAHAAYKDDDRPPSPKSPSTAYPSPSTETSKASSPATPPSSLPPASSRASTACLSRTSWLAELIDALVQGCSRPSGRGRRVELADKHHRDLHRLFSVRVKGWIFSRNRDRPCSSIWLLISA